MRYLLAVADHGGFTRAAEALHVSQPTLSQGREHPLCDSNSVLTPDDIAQLDFALLASDFITRLSIDEQVIRACKKRPAPCWEQALLINELVF